MGRLKNSEEKAGRRKKKSQVKGIDNRPVKCYKLLG
jgi:hypothetical protein